MRPRRYLAISFDHFDPLATKGTYIRSLAHDLGLALGTVAHLTSLRRETIGEFSVSAAWQFPDLLSQLSGYKEAYERQEGIVDRAPRKGSRRAGDFKPKAAHLLPDMMG